jgi:hypothetical protein
MKKGILLVSLVLILILSSFGFAATTIPGSHTLTVKVAEFVKIIVTAPASGDLAVTVSGDKVDNDGNFSIPFEDSATVKVISNSGNSMKIRANLSNNSVPGSNSLGIGTGTSRPGTYSPLTASYTELTTVPAKSTTSFNVWFNVSGKIADFAANESGYKATVNYTAIQ